MRMLHPIPARVIQVLKDFLPAELDVIDSEEGQAATPDVAAGDYWEYLRPVVLNMPCVRIDVTGATSIGVDGLNALARRLDAWYRLEVWVDVKVVSAAENASTLQRQVMTYAQAIFRVLCVKKAQLETAADPTGWATKVEPDGDIRIRPPEGQEGVLVRSGVVPIKVRRIEAA